MVGQMTPRERVLAALEHQVVDRVPIDMGGTHNRAMCAGANDNFTRHLGLDAIGGEISKAFNRVKLAEKVLQRLPVDTRSLSINKTPRGGFRALD